MKCFYSFSFVFLLAVAGCSPFANQCDQYTEVGEQLTCLDTAFLALESEVVRGEGAREGFEREGVDLREYLEFCEGLRARFAEEEWAEEHREEYGEDFRRCRMLWERLGEDRDREDCDGAAEPEREEEVERDADVSSREAVREEVREDVRDENCERGELGALRQIRDRARRAIERNESSSERGALIREALSEGRGWVDRLFGARDGAREGARDGTEERPR